MALIEIGNGAEVLSSPLNSNFEYLDDKITDTSTSLSTSIYSLQASLSTISTNLSNNKANKDLSNVTNGTLSANINFTGANTFSSSNTFSGATTFSGTVTLPSGTIPSFMPDYSAGISVSDNWTATADGWLRCKCDFAGWGTYVTLDGVKVSGVACLWAGDYSHWQSYNLIPVNAGQIVKFNGQSGYMEVQFYPMKGAN